MDKGHSSISLIRSFCRVSTGTHDANLILPSQKHTFSSIHNKGATNLSFSAASLPASLLPVQSSVNSNSAQHRDSEGFLVPPNSSDAKLGSCTMSNNPKGKRSSNCAKCKNHKVSAPVKGHKRTCPFKTCPCDKCSVTDERRRVNATQVADRRAKVNNLGGTDEMEDKISSSTGKNNLLSQKPSIEVHGLNNIVTHTAFNTREQEPSSSKATDVDESRDSTNTLLKSTLQRNSIIFRTAEVDVDSSSARTKAAKRPLSDSGVEKSSSSQEKHQDFATLTQKVDSDGFRIPSESKKSKRTDDCTSDSGYSGEDFSNSDEPTDAENDNECRRTSRRQIRTSIFNTEGENSIPAGYVSDMEHNAEEYNQNEASSQRSGPPEQQIDTDEDSCSNDNSGNKRNPTCATCRNHNVLVKLKGHKAKCPYINCRCTLCRKTRWKRVENASQVFERRKKMANQEGDDSDTDGPSTETVSAEDETVIKDRNVQNYIDPDAIESVHDDLSIDAFPDLEFLETEYPPSPTVISARQVALTMPLLHQSISLFIECLQEPQVKRSCTPKVAGYIEEVITDTKSSVKEVIGQLKEAEQLLQDLNVAEARPPFINSIPFTYNPVQDPAMPGTSTSLDYLRAAASYPTVDLRASVITNPLYLQNPFYIYNGGPELLNAAKIH